MGETVAGNQPMIACPARAGDRRLPNVLSDDADSATPEFGGRVI